MRHDGFYTDDPDLLELQRRDRELRAEIVINLTAVALFVVAVGATLIFG